jgi:5-methylcytosine-specific restriction protein A
MNEYLLKIISHKIYKIIGVSVEGFVNPASPREGLSFWFENYNRGNGPVFTIRPSGLKRHLISMNFGAYAAPCIDHIKNNASYDAYMLAHAFIEQLSKQYEIKINGELPKENWSIDTDFKIEIFRRDVEQLETENVVSSVELIMIPLMASIAELIGYEEDGDVEGTVTEAIVTKRERSLRNRLLCFSIYGEICNVCGIDPKEMYGEAIGSILEIHHIEPLSELDRARVYNPRTDLVPLCPNCHRAIHKRKPAYKPDELKDLIKND